MSFTATNTELLSSSIDKPHLNVKFILNGNGLIFFPATQQHRSIKAPGLNYEDDYRGNAVAGIITAGRIEIRFHSAFSDNLIRNLWAQVGTAAQNAGVNLTTFSVFYQGRQLK